MIAEPIPAARVTAETARLIGEDFVADNLGDQIGVGTPARVVSSLRSAWVVPLMLTSPGYGAVGIVGVLIIDEELGHISAWTAVEEIEANAARLIEENKTALESAFEQARIRGAA
jgi:hypothetical protein